MTDDVLLTLSLLLMAALVARLLSSLVRVPEILMLVAIGAALGSYGLDVIDVPFESLGAQLMFTLGVSIILFYGGLNLSLPVLRKVWVGLGLLVVPGVVLTTLVVGAAAYLVFDLPWSAALLVGAVLSPTDPAILIPLFIRSRVRAKVAQTVVAESAFNDPTGAALALALAGIVLTGDNSIGAPVSEFAVDLAVSTVIGIVAGVVLAAAISSNRSGIWRESAAIAVLAVVTISFFSLDTAGGSGYLGAFLAGLIVGNMEELGLSLHSSHETEIREFAYNLADLVTLIVFVVLGANIPFEAVGDNLLPALAVLAVLLLVARPLTVLACLLPDRGGRWERNEIVFICWTRETGVIPAALVGVLAGLGVPYNDVFASVVALAIVLTLLVQAVPARWLATRLGLLEPHERPLQGAFGQEAA
jgi:cell volume regulation protein A